MRKHPSTVGLATLLATAIACAAAWAAVPVPVTLSPKSALSVSGTSTLHAWTCTTNRTEVRVTRDDAATTGDLATLVKAGHIQAVDVTVPVLTLHSEKSGLDKNMYKALKSDEHPNITVRLTKFTAPVAGTAADTLAVQAEGTITITGNTQPAVLTGRLHPGDGGLWLEGQYTLKMTQFGIQPPKLMMGTIKVGDPVTIRYQLQFTNREAAGDAAAASGL